MRIIGIKLKEGSSSMIKNLHADTWYPFGRYVEPSEGNGWKCNSRATNGKPLCLDVVAKMQLRLIFFIAENYLKL